MQSKKSKSNYPTKKDKLASERVLYTRIYWKKYIISIACIFIIIFFFFHSPSFFLRFHWTAFAAWLFYTTFEYTYVVCAYVFIFIGFFCSFIKISVELILRKLAGWLVQLLLCISRYSVSLTNSAPCFNNLILISIKLRS